jgi:plasmid maintenance system antidote protein VapI
MSIGRASVDFDPSADGTTDDLFDLAGTTSRQDGTTKYCAAMASHRAQEPLGMALLAVLAERGMSLRALAKRIRINPSHLSRVIRGEKAATPELIKRITRTLELPAGYFIEDREQRILERIRRDGKLRDRIYDELDSS